MNDTKRIECVIDAVHVPMVLDALRSAGVDGYTVVRGASGWGDRGGRQADGISGVFENCVVLCACPLGQADLAIEKIRPIFKRFGGVALVSDAQWIIH